MPDSEIKFKRTKYYYETINSHNYFAIVIWRLHRGQMRWIRKQVRPTFVIGLMGWAKWPWPIPFIGWFSQCSCLSPAIFNVFMNVFILELRKLNCGCHVNGLFVGCLLYASDIILLSPSVEGLQMMLDTCHAMCHCLLMLVNVDAWLLVKCAMLLFSPSTYR